MREGNAKLPDALKKACTPIMVRAAPNLYVPSTAIVPEYSVCAWHEVKSGQYEPVPELTRLIRVNSLLLKALGMAHQEKTMRRLGDAGFIEMFPVAPHTWMLNLDSWYGHCRRVAEDPEFWDRGRGNIECYSDVLRGAGRLA